MSKGAHLKCPDESCRAIVMLMGKGRAMRLRPFGGSQILSVSAPDVTVECAACLGVAVWQPKKSPQGNLGYYPLADTYRLDPPPSREPRIARAKLNETVALLEERWATFSKMKLRERGKVASGLRFDVFMRDDFQCRYCGRSVDDGVVLHADHVIPESKGGPTTLENLVTSCMDCNWGKSDKELRAETAVAS